ncbi:MAG: lytic transglycosylase F [Desulfobacterales bacterium]|nr:lytic transglycosylase F [Desulfobacterales bacterium]
MIEKKTIRALVPYSKTFYFLDGANPKGASYDALKLFENHLNKKLKTKHLKIHVMVIPTPRDKLIPGLVEGLGDIAVGNLTITDHRLKFVDFSDPMLMGIDEILVTGPGTPKVNTLADLSDQTIHVRKSSSYYESLVGLNKQLSKEGKSPIKLVEANEYLEDEDLLEMVNAGLIPMIVIDSHKGEFWAQIFDKITLHPNIKFRENAKIAWAIRKKTPLLTNEINEFVKKNKKGTLHGNMIFKRYLKSTKYVENNLVSEYRKRFNATIDFFKKYGDQYDFDWLMLAALAFQESTIDQSKRSHVGAVGVMQILPTTAKDKNVNIPDIENIDKNIHAGTKYLRFMMDRYFNDPKIDKLNRWLLAFAAYNAGPAKVSKLRKEAASMGLDSNVWFRNVEVVAAKRIGRETVQYVSNIFKYYLAYRLIADKKEFKTKIKKG